MAHIKKERKNTDGHVVTHRVNVGITFTDIITVRTKIPKLHG